MCNNVHTGDVVRLSKGGEPFDVRQPMWEASKMRGQLKDNPYLSNTKAWDVVGFKLVGIHRCPETRTYLQVHQIYDNPPNSQQGGLCQIVLLFLLSSPVLLQLV